MRKTILYVAFQVTCNMARYANGARERVRQVKAPSENLLCGRVAGSRAAPILKRLSRSCQGTKLPAVAESDA